MTDEGRRKMSEAKRGFCNPRAVFLEKEVLEIRRQIAAGKPIRAIAREQGVTDTAIQWIKRRKTWGHLEHPSP